MLVPAPVLSLTVVDGTTLGDGGALLPESNVLIVARRPGANPTHPNVISVPTQRLPKSLHAALLAESTPLAGEGGFFAGAAVDSDTASGHTAVIYAVEALLARKLGLGEALESGHVRFRATLRSRVLGTAVYDNFGPGDVHEEIDMLNVAVSIDSGRERLPSLTSSYGPIGWTSVDSFLDGVQSRDPRRIRSDLDAIELCVHGVCLTAAQATLTAFLGQPLFPEPRAATTRR